MKLEGSHDVPAPRQKVWDAFLDPEQLRQAIPGCENLEALGNDEYKATMKVGVGGVKGTFEGKVRLTAGAGVSLAPTWGNDNRMFYVSDRSGFDNVWSMDLSPAIAAAQAIAPQSHLATSPGSGVDSDPSEAPEDGAPGNR